MLDGRKYRQMEQVASVDDRRRRVTAVALVFDALRGLLHQVRYAEVVQQVAAQPTSNLLWAGLATVLGYFVLTGYDVSALRYAGAKVRRSTVLLTSFIAYALGNTVGLGVLTGGAVRMRLYTAAGVEAGRSCAGRRLQCRVRSSIGMTAFGARGTAVGREGCRVRCVRMPQLAAARDRASCCCSRSAR